MPHLLRYLTVTVFSLTGCLSTGCRWAPSPPLERDASAPARPRPRLVLLTAPWCQWCRVLEAETLPAPAVRAALAAWSLEEIDVDRAPAWMDRPGVSGLPSLLFFDGAGRHVLTRSGYRSPAELASLLDDVRARLGEPDLAPFPAEPGHRRLPALPMDARRAQAELVRLERAAFIAVNSNDGGFGGPGRDPRPGMLLALAEWPGATARTRRWIDLTCNHALRGRSPRLDGAPLPDDDFSGVELADLATRGPVVGPRWRAGIDRLPDADPYEGLQDPFDYGVFRYAAGPGWYHPHFERRAADNLRWALLLRRLGRTDDAARVAGFVASTFGVGARIAAHQRSDPFYYRLRADERRGVPSPPVEPLFPVEVQALAAQVWPARCGALEAAPTDRWPRALWTEGAEDPAAAEATPDAVGALLRAMAGCPSQAARARALAEVVVARWAGFGLPGRPQRLGPLAGGICAAAPGHCGRALAALDGLPLDPEFPPPFAALDALSRLDHDAGLSDQPESD